MRWIFILPFIAPQMAVAQEASELSLVKQIFAQIQPLSIQKNREYCGYIGYDASGRLTNTKAKKGRKGSCAANDPTSLEVVIASYHTHGAFSRDYANEVPSGTDMEGDEAEGVDGWVATPGGRLWYIDSTEMVASQVCGVGCIAMDPNFTPGDMGHIAQSYSYDQLVQKLRDVGR